MKRSVKIVLAVVVGLFGLSISVNAAERETWLCDGSIQTSLKVISLCTVMEKNMNGKM